MTVSAAAVSSSEYYAAENYYTGEQEGPSQWGGQGAERLGLHGPVDAESFAKVLAGELPDGSMITRNSAGHRSNGVDLTFSAPKSVSLVTMIGGDARVLEAHAMAVQQTMAWAEERFATARAGQGGREQVLTGNLLYAAFQHDLSRKLDPQVHTHVAIVNATQRPDGEWRALHNRPLWQHAPLIGAAYHAQLRANLAELGYKTTITGKHGQFEIDGISRKTIMAFSTRREEILAKAGELGVASPKALEAVAVRTRDAKNIGDAEAARALWAEKAVEHRDEINAVVHDAREQAQPRSVLAAVRAWGEALVERITQAFGPKPEPLMRDENMLRKGPGLAAAFSVAAGVRHLAERQASFDRLGLVKAALGFAEKGATVREVEARVDRLVEAGALVRGKAGTIHADRLATHDQLATERALVKAARDGAGVGQAMLSEDKVRDGIAAVEIAKGITLTGEQTNAIESLLSGTNRIQVIQGDAGTGKSTVFSFVQTLANREGREVLFLAAQSTLVAGMRAEGLEAHTVASVLTRFAERDGPRRTSEAARAMFQGKLVIVEEASMLSARQMLALVQISERAGAAKLALVGDEKQIEAVEAGRPLALLQQHGAPTEHLSQNRRQLTPELREAVDRARAGDIEGVFAVLGDKVREASNPTQAAAAHYLALSDAERQRTAIFTSGHVLRAEVLAEVREGLIARGELGAQSLTLQSLDRLNLTREELRQIANWAPGMQLDIFRYQAGIEPGSYAVEAVHHADGHVLLRRDGQHTLLDPASLHPAGKGASLSVPGEMEVREGDQLVFTSTDRDLGVVNGTRALCTGIEEDSLHLQIGERDVVLGPEDPMRERLAQAAVLNMHRAQGLTVDRAITVMRSENRLLNSQSLHYVLQTRAREDVMLFTDDREALRESIETHAGVTPHALDLAPELTDSGGERFDPATGELMAPNEINRPTEPADRFAANLEREFSDRDDGGAQHDEAVREEPHRGDDDPEIDYDFER